MGWLPRGLVLDHPRPMQRMGKNAGPAVADTGRALPAVIGLLALLNLLQGMLMARGTFCLTNEATAFSWLPGSYRCEPLQTDPSR